MHDSSISRCASFIQTQLRNGIDAEAHPRIALTVSRQLGSRAHVICEELVRRLSEGTDFASGEWFLFDHNLMKKVLQDHELPERLERFLPEDATGELNQLMGEILGLHPPTWEIFQNTCETIYRLAHVGNVVIAGRAANLVTRELPNVVRVRMLGSVSARVAHLAQELDLHEDAARQRVRDDDRAKARYVRTYFGRDIDDPSDFDLVVRTDRLEDGAVVEMLIHALRSCAHRCSGRDGLRSTIRRERDRAAP